MRVQLPALRLPDKTLVQRSLDIVFSFAFDLATLPAVCFAATPPGNFEVDTLTPLHYNGNRHQDGLGTTNLPSYPEAPY